MIVFPRGEVKTWRDLTPGALFGLSISGETHLGVKIQGSGGGFHCAAPRIPAALRERKRGAKLAALFLPKQQNSSSR